MLLRHEEDIVIVSGDFASGIGLDAADGEDIVAVVNPYRKKLDAAVALEDVLSSAGVVRAA